MTVIIIPAFNEGRTIADIVRRARRSCDLVIVVNDGSSDTTAQEAEQAGAFVVNHIINRGVGAAWNTGFQAALLKGAHVVVVMDADGQHDPDDIARLVQPIVRGDVDVALSVRDFSYGMPFMRRLMNRIANFTTYLFFGIYVKDSQSGFRALSRDAVSRIQLKTNHFEVCSEMIGEIKRLGLRFEEVPIKSIYTDYSLSKGQGARSGLNTLRALIINAFTRK